jgi:hypothetical protein
MIRKLTHGIFSLLFLLGCAAFVPAQSDDDPRVEVFGGYSYLRTDYNPVHPVPFIPIIVAFDPKQTLHGVNASVTGYLTKCFGITGDFSAHFKRHSIPDPLGGTITTDIRVINLTGGPQYKFRNKSRVTPFAHALAGVAFTSSKDTIPSLNATGTSSSTDFTMMLGGGVDARVNKHFDARVFQADYNPVFLSRLNQLGFGKTRADNIRFSFGLVWKH